MHENKMSKMSSRGGRMSDVVISRTTSSRRSVATVAISLFKVFMKIINPYHLEGLSNQRNPRQDLFKQKRECVFAKYCKTVSTLVNEIFTPTRYRSGLKITVFSFLLCLNISTAWAAKTCDCGSTENGGSVTDCCWEINNGVLTITVADGATNVAIKNYSSKNIGTATGYVNQWASTAPWARQYISSVKIDERIIEIGEYAFYGEDSLIAVDMPGVTTVKKNAFNQAHGLSDVNMPNVESIGTRAFAWTNINSIDLPNIRTIGEKAFTDNAGMGLEYIGTNSTYIDENGIEQDVSIAKDAFSIYDSSTNSYNTLQPVMSSCSLQNNYKICGSCGDKYVKSGMGCVTAENCGEGYTADNETKQCLKNASTSPQQMDNQDNVALGEITPDSCDANGQVYYQEQCYDEYPFAKKHYTPAEAAQWLHDGNDNFVIITFKK